MSDATPIIMVGIDAADITLIDQLCAAGRMPTLHALRQRGAHGLLTSKPDAFLSMVWPSFNSATDVAHHGWYLNKVWRRERMRVEYAKPDWLSQQAFWELLDGRRYKVALLDVPFSMRAPQNLNGVYLNGWQNHDDFGRLTQPKRLWRDLQAKFGKPAMRAELFGPQDARTLVHLRQQMIDATEQFAALSAHVLESEDWDLFLTVFGSAHRCGHYLWDLSQIDNVPMDPRARELLAGALAEVYEACDRGLARVLAKAGESARVLVFALHGMGPNSGWFEHFAAMVDLIRRDGVRAAPKTGALYRVKKALPWRLVRQVTTRLPAAVNQALVPLWSQRMHDWKSTPYFVLPGDLNGYIRINLKGREPEGIVEPGAQMDDICTHLKEALESFEDVNTGEPVVASVERVDDLVAPGAPRRDNLPDLVVQWNTVRAYDSTGMYSQRYGELGWARGAPLPSGRSGNHAGPGWFVATGPGIRPGHMSAPHDIIDLGPTLLDWLNVPPAAHVQGRAIRQLVAD